MYRTGETERWISRSSNAFNIFRPRRNGRHFPDNIFKCIFLNENVAILIKYLTEVCSQWQYSSIGSDDDLAPNRRQAIIRTSADISGTRGDELRIRLSISQQSGAWYQTAYKFADLLAGHFCSNIIFYATFLTTVPALAGRGHLFRIALCEISSFAYYNDATWMPWRFKPSAHRLFVQQIAQTNNKWNIKDQYYWSTCDR